jgi:SAM-dependent methyltransferase
MTARPAIDLSGYFKLKALLAPRLRFNQVIYEEILTGLVRAGTVWLDAGCGRRILPPWRGDAERALVGTCKLAIGCDLDAPAMWAHRTLRRLAASDLEHLPFGAETIDLITCNMVVEHLDDPAAVFAEFARVLRPSGRVLVHTPNAYSYFVIGSRLLPSGPLKRRLAGALDGREEAEIFPTRYRANTPGKLRSLMRQAGLREESTHLVANDAVLARVSRVLAALELLYIRLTLLHAFRLLRVTILASFVKDGGGTPVASVD